MKQITLAIIISIGAISAAHSLTADIAVGTVLAFDRKAKTLILTDRTVWLLSPSSNDIPEGLAAGDRVQFSYQLVEDGVSSILQINITHESPPGGAREIAKGTVLAYDRKARLLVFADKTAWSLENMQATLPFGLNAGDRIEIDYESDEDGNPVIHDIMVLSD
jgi:hypothetical protein